MTNRIRHLLQAAFVLLVSFNAAGQPTAMERLQQAAATGNPDSMRWYYQEAYRLGLNEKAPEAVSDALYALGKYYVGAGMLDSAQAVADRGIALNRTGQAVKAEVFINIKAATFHHRSMLDSAVHYYLDAVRILEEKEDTLKASYILYNIGNIFLSYKDFSQAEEYFSRVHKTILHFKDSTYLPGVLVSLSATRYELGDMSQALAYAQEALQLSTARNDVMSLMLAHRQLGELAINSKQYEKAVNHFRQAWPLAEMIRMPYYMALVRMGLANAYNRSGNYKAAITEGEASLQLSAGPQFATQLTTVYTILSEAYSGIQDYKSAYKYLEMSADRRDSIASTENKKVVHDLLVKYDTEKKDRELAEQRLDLAETQAKNRLFLALMIASVCALSVLILVYTYRRRLHRLNLKRIQEAQENKVLQAIITGEEQERIRLSSELHDGLHNPLFSCKLMLTDMMGQSESNDQLQEKLRQSIEVMDTLQKEVRSMAHNLMPQKLEEEGLPAALQQYFGRLRHTGATSVFFQQFGTVDIALTKQHQLILFRIIQELTGNALKHAEATEIDVQLFLEPGTVKITVEDNGKGFDTHTHAQGQGLQDIRKRIALISGTLSVESAPGNGTHISVQVNTADA